MPVQSVLFSTARNGNLDTFTNTNTVNSRLSFKNILFQIETLLLLTIGILKYAVYAILFLVPESQIKIIFAIAIH